MMDWSVGYKGKLVHHLTLVFPDGAGSDDYDMEYAEFASVAATHYADAILVFGYIATSISTKRGAPFEAKVRVMANRLSLPCPAAAPWTASAVQVRSRTGLC